MSQCRLSPLNATGSPFPAPKAKVDPMRAGSLREFIDRYETKHGVKPDNRKMMAFYDAHPDIFEAETGSSVAEANKRIKGGKR